MGLGGGLGYRHDFFPDGSVLGTFQLFSLTAGLGWFADPAVAVQARFSVTASAHAEMASSNDGTSNIYQHFIGLESQVFLGDKWMVSGAAGGSMIYAKDGDHAWGVGILLRGGFGLGTLKHHTLRVVIELLGSFYESRVTLTETFCLEWQWH